MKHTIKRKPRLATIKAVPKQWVFDGERLNSFEPGSIEERVQRGLKKIQTRQALSYARKHVAGCSAEQRADLLKRAQQIMAGGRLD